MYLDTTVVSSYWYEGGDVLAWGRRLLTRDWWDGERPQFTVFASQITEEELTAGVYPRQFDCVRMVRKLRYLQIHADVRELANLMLAARLVPREKPGDALQMAVAAAHEVDYLLTWNYAHLANPVAQANLIGFANAHHFRAPLLVSPDTIPKSGLAQSIRRTPK